MFFYYYLHIRWMKRSKKKLSQNWGGFPPTVGEWESGWLSICLHPLNGMLYWLFLDKLPKTSEIESNFLLYVHPFPLFASLSFSHVYTFDSLAHPWLERYPQSKSYLATILHIWYYFSRHLHFIPVLYAVYILQH